MCKYLAKIQSDKLIALLPKIAELYCKIWREPPWNEHNWKEEIVASHIKKLLENPTFAISITRDNETRDVTGFCWGYIVNKAEMRNISGTTALDHIFNSNTLVGYIAELGVLKSHRNKGLGRIMSSVIIENLSGQGASTIILRTDVQAESARHLYISLGFEELDVTDSEHTTRTYWLLKP